MALDYLNITNIFTKEFIQETLELKRIATNLGKRVMPIQFINQNDLMPEVEFMETPYKLNFIGTLYSIKLYSYLWIY